MTAHFRRKWHKYSWLGRLRWAWYHVFGQECYNRNCLGSMRVTERGFWADTDCPYEKWTCFVCDSSYTDIL